MICLGDSSNDFFAAANTVTPMLSSFFSSGFLIRLWADEVAFVFSIKKA